MESAMQPSVTRRRSLRTASVVRKKIDLGSLLPRLTPTSCVTLGDPLNLSMT